MITPYRELFARPGTKAFTLAGLLARLSMPMTGIGIMTMLSQLHGNYTLAGAVAATVVLTYAVLSPQISRLVDRYGQHRILPATTAISVTGTLLMLISTWWQTANWALFIGAFLAGFMPSMPALIRARWTALYRGQPLLRTAYSLETVLDEISFIAGPPLSLGLSVILFPQAGPLVAALLLALGVTALVVQRATEPPIEVPEATLPPSGSLIRLANLRLLMLLMVAMGVIVGTVDIVSMAFAQHRNQPVAASLVLSAYALGSCLSGLLFGTYTLRTPLHRLLLLCGLATAIMTLPMLLVDTIPALALVVLVAGVFFAPTLIVAMSLVERLVPKHQLTEGMTWLLAGLNIGVALGAAIAGLVLDAEGTQAGFTVALGAGILVLLLTLRGHQRLSDTASLDKTENKAA